MRILVYGAGGIGGFFGGLLARSGEDVWFVARGSHLEAMKLAGLRMKSTMGNFTIPAGRMADRPEAAGPVDVVFMCVKTYDTQEASRLLDPVLKRETIIITFQNGIDNDEQIRRVIRRGEVSGGVANVSARITAPGEVTETGGLQRLVFGPMDGKEDARYEDLGRRCVSAGINAVLSKEMRKELWRKFVFITSMGSFTAVSRLTQGEILKHPESLDTVLSAMHEAVKVAQAVGVNMEEVNKEKSIESWRRFNPETRSSMYFDLIHDRPLEVESLNGTLIRLAEAHRIDVPTHRLFYSVLAPHHRRNVEMRKRAPL